MSNPDTRQIDRVTTLEMLEMINNEDQKAAAAVRLELPAIARAVDLIAESLMKGGRLFYAGAGTSGRIGVLDASEIPPTFGTPPEMVQAILAGGRDAVFAAIEGAEDDSELGAADVREHGVCAGDVIVGITASGRTPYVLGAVEAAMANGAAAVGLSNSAGSLLAENCHIAITPLGGAEALTGSTRMKAGTMQKMVLNMLTTGAMIRMGKTYSNLMADLIPTNEKLRDRAVRIVAAAAETDFERAGQALETAGNAKVAIIMLKTGKSPLESAELLEKHRGHCREALESL